jgi:hypothetical protein
MVEPCRRSSSRNASTTTEALRERVTARQSPGRFDSWGARMRSRAGTGALARFRRQCFHIPSTPPPVSWMKRPAGRASSWISPLWPGDPRHMVRLARRGQRKRTGEARGDPRSAAGPVGRAARFVRAATAGPGVGRPRSHQGWSLPRSKPFGSRFLRAFPCPPPARPRPAPPPLSRPRTAAFDRRGYTPAMGRRRIG